MRSLSSWEGRKLYEANDANFMIPSEKKPIGNELRNVETGGQILDSPFKKKTEDFKKSLTQLPTPQEEHKKGLGELGMEKVGKSTFGNDSIAAGTTPTLSQGMPVQEALTNIIHAQRSQGSDQAQAPAQQAQAAPTGIMPATQRRMDMLIRDLGGKNVRVVTAVRDALNREIQRMLTDKGRERWGANTGYKQAVATKQGVGQPQSV